MGITGSLDKDCNSVLVHQDQDLQKTKNISQYERACSVSGLASINLLFTGLLVGS